MSVANAQSPLLTSPSGTPEGTSQTATNDSQSPGAATGMTTPPPQTTTAAVAAAAATAAVTAASKPPKTPASPGNPSPPRKADTAMSWGVPAGLPMRNHNDENLMIFRRALGINTHRAADGCDDSGSSSGGGRSRNVGGTLEEGRKRATGVYRAVIETRTRMAVQHALLQALVYAVYFVQIVVGAALTALGAAAAARHEGVITALGVLNTVLAGVLALIKGSGQPHRLGRDRVAHRRLQDWIEQTEALLAVGVVGRNRREVGLLVESAFKRYNAAKTGEENNDPDFYAYQPREPLGNRGSDDGRG